MEIAPDILRKAAALKLVLFDVDGVLTDGRLYYGDDGQEYKAFHSRDGHGMRMLLDSGVEIGIITGRTSQLLTHRTQNLGIEHVYQGHRDKLPAFKELLSKLALTPEQTAYVGDDVMDLPIMTRAGLAIAVNDAHALVRQQADWITPTRGGRGAAREVCELILQAQGHYDELMEAYLR